MQSLFNHPWLYIVWEKLLQKSYGKNLRRNQIVYWYAIKTPLKPSGKIKENDMSYIDYCLITNSYEKTLKRKNHKQVWRSITWSVDHIRITSPQNPMGKNMRRNNVFDTFLKTLVGKTEDMTSNMSWISPLKTPMGKRIHHQEHKNRFCMS